MDLKAFMDAGAQDIVRTAAAYYLRSVRGARYLAHAAASLPKASKRRERHSTSGAQIPPFLIASISSE